MIAFMVFSFVLALVTPAWPRYTRAVLDVTEHLPFMAYLAPFDPAPHWANYFATMWLAMPAWVVAMGVAVLRNPARTRLPLPRLLSTWLLGAGVLAGLALFPSEEPGSLAAASHWRWMGALYFTGGLTAVFTTLTLVLVVCPVDFMRTPLLRDELPRGW